MVLLMRFLMHVCPFGEKFCFGAEVRLSEVDLNLYGFSLSVIQERKDDCFAECNFQRRHLNCV